MFRVINSTDIMQVLLFLFCVHGFQQHGSIYVWRNHNQELLNSGWLSEWLSGCEWASKWVNECAKQPFWDICPWQKMSYMICYTYNLFHSLWAHNQNLEKYTALTWQIMVASGHNFAHAKTAQLPWHMQNSELIWSIESKFKLIGFTPI